MPLHREATTHLLFCFLISFYTTRTNKLTATSGQHLKCYIYLLDAIMLISVGAAHPGQWQSNIVKEDHQYIFDASRFSPQITFYVSKFYIRLPLSAGVRCYIIITYILYYGFFLQKHVYEFYLIHFFSCFIYFISLVFFLFSHLFIKSELSQVNFCIGNVPTKDKRYNNNDSSDSNIITRQADEVY